MYLAVAQFNKYCFIPILSSNEVNCFPSQFLYFKKKNIYRLFLIRLRNQLLYHMLWFDISFSSAFPYLNPHLKSHQSFTIVSNLENIMLHSLLSSNSLSHKLLFAPPPPRFKPEQDFVKQSDALKYQQKDTIRRTLQFSQNVRI